MTIATADDDSSIHDAQNSTITTYSPSPAATTTQRPTELPSSNATSFSTNTSYIPLRASEESFYNPTYYPTYSPTTYSPTTTLQKGSHKQRDKSKQQNKERMPPTESPTIQKIQFLEDVSASKTLAMVIGLMLTLLGIGLCAWCM